jgi:hypothetical protein
VFNPDRAGCVIIVEGQSDRVALETLARRRGYDLEASGIAIVPIGGAHAINRVLTVYGPGGRNVRLAGLCDLREEEKFRRGLERAGMGAGLTRTQMEQLGFFVCDVDLEDELIKVLGPEAIDDVVLALGDREPWHAFQKQPAQRGRDRQQQMRRFIRSKTGRNVRYALAFVERLEVARLPRPLVGLLDYV